MLIDEKRCQEIGLPKPESFDTEKFLRDENHTFREIT